jgi:hypothetical protein
MMLMRDGSLPAEEKRSRIADAFVLELELGT